jgi:hypothetical protein
MGLHNGANDVQRFFIGIGVGSYDDATLDLPKAESDVAGLADWFTRRSGVAHSHALPNLGKSPKASEILESLRAFLQGCTETDVVVLYMACHGELEGSRAHLFARNTPRKALAGLSIDASVLGAILGQSKPHNILLVIDACVAGRIGSALQRAAEDAADEEGNRDPHRPYAQVVVASTFGRDPAFDGRFAEAFLNVVSNERWTGTSNPWLAIDQLITGLNEELRDLAVAQVAERREWGTAAAELIPNPNVASRQLGKLMADEEFEAHFDPAARGVARGERGSFFTGRDKELKRIVKWLDRENHDVADGDRMAPPSLLVITGSPGSGKSALLSRVAVLADPAHRPDDKALTALTECTVPPKGALDAVVWCHNKTARQLIDAIAAALGGSASTPDTLLHLAHGRSLGRGTTIAIDALDETQDGLARHVASHVLWPLSRVPGIRLLVATRRRPVRDGEGGQADLLDHLRAEPASVIDLDAAPDTRDDIRAYVEARIRAGRPDAGDSAQLGDLADRIADAAGNSFLVAAIAARSAVAGGLTRADGTYLLPTEVGEALAGYIDALPDPLKARGLLRALAWSHGAGLPWGTLWPRIATALSEVAGAAAAYDDGDVRALLDRAGDLIVESVEAGQPVYRLFHEALAEHLRAETDEVRSHGALADAMREVVGARPWPQVQRYVTANLPLHLLRAGRMDDLIEILADPTWDRCRREQTGDPLAAVGVADAAVERLLAQSPTDLRGVALCVVHSRAMSTAAPLILDVIARSGQLARAEMMANNLVYTPDRMLAYRYLCALYARERDKDAARRCFEEVRRSLPAMPETHQPMAWFWVAEAAAAAGLVDRVSAAAQASVEAAFAIKGDGWDLPNGYFWAARACGLGDAEDGTLRIRAALDLLDSSDRGMTWRNQALQAASVARHIGFLEKRLDQYFGGLRYPAGMIRDGNIALALADAGMNAEANRVFELVGDGAPKGNADSNKRWCWGLALCGRMDEAIRALSHVHDPIEKSKAIARIASLAREREENKILEALRPLVQELLAGIVYEARARARLIRVLWLADEQAEALRLVEQEIAVGLFASLLADPRDGIGPDEGAADPTERGRAKKAGKREMVSSVVLISDERWANDAEFAASNGKIDEARQHLQKIAMPSCRARALASIAKNDSDREQAIAGWLQAMAEARRAGRAAIDRIRPLGIELLNRAGRTEDAKKLNADIEAIEMRWELESFSEQYEGLRKTMSPSGDRTRQMTVLLYVPRRLAGAHPWTLDDIRRIWASGEDGKRLFALGLIQGDSCLAVAEVLADAIRGSRSAFEQYAALLAAREAKLDGDALRTVLNAVDAEIRGVPRPDGVDSGLTQGTGRTQLAKQLLAPGEY